MPLENRIHETLFRKSDKQKVINALEGVMNMEPQDYSNFNKEELMLMAEMLDMRIKAVDKTIQMLVKEFGYIPS